MHTLFLALGCVGIGIAIGGLLALWLRDYRAAQSLDYVRWERDEFASLADRLMADRGKQIAGTRR